MKTVDKIWGREELLINTELYCAKYLYINPGYQTSFHYHKLKDETFIVISGFLNLILDSQIVYLTQGGCGIHRLKPNTNHQLRNLAVSELKVLEISTNHKDSDSYRITKGGEIQ